MSRLGRWGFSPLFDGEIIEIDNGRILTQQEIVDIHNSFVEYRENLLSASKFVTASMKAAAAASAETDASIVALRECLSPLQRVADLPLSDRAIQWRPRILDKIIRKARSVLQKHHGVLP